MFTLCPPRPRAFFGGDGRARSPLAFFSMLLSLPALLGAALAFSSPPAAAELKELVIAQQPGIGYLNLIVMKEQKLIEKYAKAAGLGDIKVTWQAINSGQAMNEALNTEKLHIAAGGVAPLIFAWANSQ
ncbi:MAG TPA: hypothetical protein VH105_11345, partial [Burkholderiales bacterium]|nr:hypothetical protein [Burkholderiales bacterium]